MTDDPYVVDDAYGLNYRLMLGDSCERLLELESESIDLSCYSPPFSSLYSYSDSLRDMGNSRDRNEFFQHYLYVIREVLRVTKPGRLSAVHVMDLSTTKSLHGEVGLSDFSGEVLRAHQDAGWIYVARITVRKNPQAASMRTHAQGLAFAQLHRDSSKTRPVHPDYVLVFRKPGDNVVPIRSDVDNDTWIQWAEAIWDEPIPASRDEFLTLMGEYWDRIIKPDRLNRPPLSAIWDDIRETNTLNAKAGRDERDSKHIAPLQLDLIERCVRLWSNPGELILSPFGGIGSEPYVAVKNGRRAISCELKPSYWRTAVSNLRRLEAEMSAPTIFDFMEESA